jgi:hypothetical protein
MSNTWGLIIVVVVWFWFWFSVLVLVLDRAANHTLGMYTGILQWSTNYVWRLLLGPSLYYDFRVNLRAVVAVASDCDRVR